MLTVYVANVMSLQIHNLRVQPQPDWGEAVAFQGAYPTHPFEPISFSLLPSHTSIFLPCPPFLFLPFPLLPRNDRQIHLGGLAALQFHRWVRGHKSIFRIFLSQRNASIFTARRYASAVLVVIVCLSVRPSVCPSVCLSQVGVVQRWLNLGSD